MFHIWSKIKYRTPRQHILELDPAFEAWRYLQYVDVFVSLAGIVGSSLDKTVVSGSVAFMYVAVQGCEVSWENILLEVKNDKKREPRNRLNFTRTYVSFMFPVADTLCSEDRFIVHCKSNNHSWYYNNIQTWYCKRHYSSISFPILNTYLFGFFLFNVLFFPNTLRTAWSGFFYVQNSITFHLRSLLCRRMLGLILGPLQRLVLTNHRR